MKILITKKQAQLLLKNIGNGNSIIAKAGVLDSILDDKQSLKKYNVIINTSEKQGK